MLLLFLIEKVGVNTLPEYRLTLLMNVNLIVQSEKHSASTSELLQNSGRQFLYMVACNGVNSKILYFSLMVVLGIDKNWNFRHVYAFTCI